MSPVTTSADVSLGPESIARLNERAQFVRTETVRLISIAKTGHYASTFSCAEILAALYYDVMNLRAGDPTWAERDRFLMGKGHAAVGLYPILADWGFIDARLLDEYTRLGNPLGDHPDMTQVPGVDFSSGSLGHALSVAVGMQHAARVQDQNFHTFVLLGDGELQEGQVWEAALNAAHYGLRNLVAIVDRNQYSLDGKIDDLLGIEPLTDKWRAFGWNCIEVDGHDVRAVTEVLRAVKSDPNEQRPTVVIAHTVKGKGIQYMETEVGWHLGWLDSEDEKDAYIELAGGLK